MQGFHWQAALLVCPIILSIVPTTNVTALHVPRTRNHGPSRLLSQQAQKERTTRASCALSFSVSITETPAFSGAFDNNQMDALQQRGELEASLMQHSFQGPLEAPAKKKSKKKKNAAVSNKPKDPSAPTFIRELKQEGVVRVNHALSASTADLLRADILERRDRAYDAVAEGEDWRQYFADVLLKSNRCDLLLPLKGSHLVQTALRELLADTSTLSKVLSSTLTDDAQLYELATLISEPGSPRQPVHPDNPYQQYPPLLTCFIALQDVTEEMGPTIFLPKTHTKGAHDQFDDITFHDVSNRDNLLKETPNVAAQLNSGDVAVFDSRTMHCGGANTMNGGSTRALLYMSFRNPSATESIGNVGSIMPDIEPITLGKLRKRLDKMKGGDASSFDPFDE
jgi:ectoine hydroxylase-related dioxygenase (phytanoyl-CoA dioxygenase family)